jgi:hypothetical protein
MLSIYILFLGFIWRHKSDGGSTLKQNTVIKVSRLFVLCISLVFGGKYMEFRIIFSLQNSININTFEVDPPSDSLHNAVVKPNNWISKFPARNFQTFQSVIIFWSFRLHKLNLKSDIACFFRVYILFLNSIEELRFIGTKCITKSWKGGTQFPDIVWR